MIPWPARPLRIVIVTVMLVLAVTALAMLGFWQLDRARQKQATLDSVAQVLQQRRPVAVVQALDRAASDFAWSEVNGRFVAPLMLLDNQQYQGRVGLRLYAPLALPGQQTRLLVDMGWLPWPAGRVLPVIQLPDAPVTLAGLLAPPPSVGLRVGDVPSGGESPLLLTRLDPGELSTQGDVHYAARVLRLDPASPLGYARDLDMLVNTLPPERHLGYAAQWFALAVALCCLVLWRQLRKKTS